MTAIEYAQKILDEFLPKEKAISIEKSNEPLTCIIICESGKRQKAIGYWAVEIMKLMQSNNRST